MLKISLILVFLCMAVLSFSQAVIITNYPGTTGNMPFGSAGRHCSEHIYLQSEISAQTNGPLLITHLALKPDSIIPNPMTFTNLKLYLKTTTLDTFIVGGTYPDASGYTLVFSGSLTFSQSGFSNITLSTPFYYPNTLGTNLLFMVIRDSSNSNIGHTFYAATGNNLDSTNFTSRRFNSTSIVPVVGVTPMTLSWFRCAIAFNNNSFPTAIISTDKENLTSLFIYPNPTKSKLYIKNRENRTKQLFNIFGQLMLSSTESEIDVSHFNSGSYFMKCDGQTEKVMIE